MLVPSEATRLRLFQSLFAGAIDDDEFWIVAARQNLHIGEPLGR